MAKTPPQGQRTAMLSETGTERSTAATARLVGGGIILALLILFFLQNLQSTDINFLWFTWSMRVIWALLGAAVGGALVAIAAVTLRRRRAAHRTNV